MTTTSSPSYPPPPPPPLESKWKRRTKRARKFWGYVVGFIGLVGGIIALVFVWIHNDWRLFDWRSTNARIDTVENVNGAQDSRLVEVTVECDSLDFDTELWLIVWKHGEPDSALWPVASGGSECGTWTRRFNVGSRGEEGVYDIRLYHVESSVAADWREAKNDARELRAGEQPVHPYLDHETHERPS